MSVLPWAAQRACSVWEVLLCGSGKTQCSGPCLSPACRTDWGVSWALRRPCRHVNGSLYFFQKLFQTLCGTCCCQGPACRRTASPVSTLPAGLTRCELASAGLSAPVLPSQSATVVCVAACLWPVHGCPAGLGCSASCLRALGAPCRYTAVAPGAHDLPRAVQQVRHTVAAGKEPQESTLVLHMGEVLPSRSVCWSAQSSSPCLSPGK